MSTKPQMKLDLFSEVAGDLKMTKREFTHPVALKPGKPWSSVYFITQLFKQIHWSLVINDVNVVVKLVVKFEKAQYSGDCQFIAVCYIEILTLLMFQTWWWVDNESNSQFQWTQASFNIPQFVINRFDWYNGNFFLHKLELVFLFTIVNMTNWRYKVSVGH